MKVFNNLLPNIKNLAHGLKKFRLAVKRFLLSNPFHSLDEYLNYISPVKDFALWQVGCFQHVGYVLLS
jgi:hypothetical protein